MRPYERFAYRIFGGVGVRAAEQNPHLRQALPKAHLYLRPGVYLSAAILTAVIATAATLLPVILMGLLQVTGVIAVPVRLYLFLLPAPFVLGMMVYLLALVLPDLRIVSRTRQIDAKLPYAINFLSTMSSAGATPQALFASLAKQPVYGPVAQEAAWITRDLNILGLDIIAALGAATERSASARFQDLLQGISTTLSAGGDLRGYLNSKAEQFIIENRQDQRRFLDSLGVLAESFVTVVVAAPLFLIIILSVLTSLGGSPQEALFLGYALVFFLIPMSQLGFGWAVSAMTPEA